MGWSDRYEGYADEFPEYVLFFRRLVGMQTELWLLTCDKSSVASDEKAVIIEYGPVWEEFKRQCRIHGVRKGEPLGQAVSRRDFTNPALPTLDGLQSKRQWAACDRGD